MIILSFKQHLPGALTRAREWRPDAFLDYILSSATRAGSPLSLEIGYGFSSSESPTTALLVTYINETERYHVDEFTLPSPRGDTPPILDVDWMVDSPAVLETAMRSGGNDFLLKNPNNVHISVSLDHGMLTQQDASRLWWMVSFGVLGRQSGALRVTIDPISGEVVEVR